MSETFYVRDQIPLSYIRVRGGVATTGLNVSVTVKNSVTGATLLSAQSLSEVTAGAGFYLYNWTHGQVGDVDCLAIYTVSGQNFYETFTVSDNDLTGRSF